MTTPEQSEDRLLAWLRLVGWCLAPLMWLDSLRWRWR